MHLSYNYRSRVYDKSIGNTIVLSLMQRGPYLTINWAQIYNLKQACLSGHVSLQSKHYFWHIIKVILGSDDGTPRTTGEDTGFRKGGSG